MCFDNPMGYILGITYARHSRYTSFIGSSMINDQQQANITTNDHPLGGRLLVVLRGLEPRFTA